MTTPSPVAGACPPGGCGHYQNNHDYAAAAQRIRAERAGVTVTDEAASKESTETPADVDARLGKLCELCGKRSFDTRQFGTPLVYTACADVIACEVTRRLALGGFK